MEKENLLTYFTKDANWIPSFFIGSILIYIISILNSLEIKGILSIVPAMVGKSIIGLIVIGFFMMNTNSLLNCLNEQVKLAGFNNLIKLFIIGLKYCLAVFIYWFGLAAVFIVLSIIFDFSVLRAAFMIIIGLFAIYLACMLSCMYSNFLTFRSMFKFSNFSKFRGFKYKADGSVLIMFLLLSLTIVFATVIKDHTPYIYFILLLLAPMFMWYLLVLSKIQAGFIQNSIAKENEETMQNNN